MTSGFLEMAPSESSEVEQVARRIAETRIWLRGAKSVESFDLATTLQREITELEERRRHLLHQETSGVAEELSAPAIGESLRPTIPIASADTAPNDRIGW